MDTFETITLKVLFYDMKRFKEWKKCGPIYQDMISFYEGCVYTGLQSFTHYVFIKNRNYDILHRIQDLWNKIKGV